MIVTIKSDGIVNCQSSCVRFKAYNICEHTLSVAQLEGSLKPFLDNLKKKQASRFTSRNIANISNVHKSPTAGKKASKATSKRKGRKNSNKTKAKSFAVLSDVTVNQSTLTSQQTRPVSAKSTPPVSVQSTLTSQQTRPISAKSTPPVSVQSTLTSQQTRPVSSQQSSTTLSLIHI